jgi:hypothetical protein
MANEVDGYVNLKKLSEVVKHSINLFFSPQRFPQHRIAELLKNLRRDATVVIHLYCMADEFASDVAFAWILVRRRIH